MSEYYVPSGSPSTGASLASSVVRSEFTSLSAGFDKLPALTGCGNQFVAVNPGGTALTSVNNSVAQSMMGLAIGTNVQAWDADLDAIAALDATVGILIKTAAATYARRSVIGTANEVTVTNGNGQCGNITISLPTAMTMTGKTLTGGTYNGGTVTNLAAALLVGSGGTGCNSLTQNAVILGNAANSVQLVAPGTANNVLISNGSTWASGFPKLPAFNNSLSADVVLNNTSAYFDGPSIAQGSTGVWFASGTVTFFDSAAASTFQVKLWDGTTVIASGAVRATDTNYFSCSLSGYLASPTGNIRISVKDLSNLTGKIVFNATGEAKDSTISAVRVS